MAQYITETQATTRYGNRLPHLLTVTDSNGAFITHDVWTDASTADKGKALKQATSFIDEFVYDGKVKDDTQDLKFPREGQTQVPDEVKEATLEAALFLLKQHEISKDGAAFPNRYKQQGAESYTVSLGEASEKVTFGNEESVYSVIHPFVKKWIKSNYKITRWSV